MRTKIEPNESDKCKYFFRLINSKGQTDADTT